MKYLAVVILFFCCKQLQAQLTVRNSNDPIALAQKIVGQGVTILNPVFKGAPVSAGFFVDRTGTVGIDSGIVLTTGRVETNGISSQQMGVNGAANLKVGYTNNAASDNDLNNLLGGNSNTQDACVLEFDFIPQGDSINVNFVFASDEYPQYNCTEYNDVFGFLVSGPGIVGVKNIALVPGTNIPVAINSINSGFVSLGFGGNIINCTSMGSGSPFTNLYRSNLGNAVLSYNGLTTVLKAQLKVQPCQTYHIKLAIQDVFDGDYDSGVFLQASSFSSNASTISNIGGFTDAQNNTVIVEGCKSSKVKISLAQPATTTIQLPLLISGTATLGVDYVALPNQLTFNVGEREKVLDIFPIMDNVVEPTETIIIGISGSSCSNSNNNSITIYLKDSLAFYSKKDTFVCSQFATVVQAKIVDTTTNIYIWSSGEATRTKNISTPGTYWVAHRFSNSCYNIDTFNVISGDPIVSIGNNVSFCATDSVLINATVSPSGGVFLWNNGSSNTSIHTKTTQVVSLKYTLPNGCFIDRSIQSTVKPLPIVELGADTSLCNYEKLTLNAFYAGATYLWNTGATNATLLVSDSAKYYVTNTLNGCIYSDTILVGRKKQAIANAGANIEIYTGGSANLVAQQYVHNQTYLWLPNSQLSNANSATTKATPNSTTSYYLKVTSVDNCLAYDTIVVTVKDGNIIIPNAFSPNGDGINDVWEIKLLSSFLSVKVQVYNRQGQMVFNSVGYNSPWNGTHNGKPLPVGTYYYIIEPGNGLPKQTGWIAILR